MGILITLFVLFILIKLSTLEQAESCIKLCYTTPNGETVEVDTSKKTYQDPPNAIPLDFDVDIFRKNFVVYFQNSKNDIEKALESAVKETLKSALQKINPTYKGLRFNMFVVNTYTMGKSYSYKDLQSKGFYINCIRGSFKTPDKQEVPPFKFQTNAFSQYCDNYRFITTKMTPKKTVCKFEITNSLIAPEVFAGLIDTNNCECDNLQFYNHDSELPLLFICPVCGKLYMCECQREYYTNIRSDDFEYLYNKATYKSNICFICQKKVPPELYSYSGITTFGRRYEAYIKALIKAHYGGWEYNPDYSYKDGYDNYRRIRKEAENTIRAQVGYPLIGERWLNETTLYKICCMLFEECNIIREYSPPWLNKKRIDIFISEYNLGIEYQGEQHFRAIEHFGGEEGLAKTQTRDKEKAKLCRENGVTLVYFNFDEELTEQMVLKKLEKYTKT